MTAIDAVYADGAFRPLAPVHLPENQRVRLTVEAAGRPIPAEWAEWLAAATAHRARLEATYGLFDDSTAIIAADRRRDG